MLAQVPEVVTEVLAILTDPGAYPVLIHCGAGKDRTGVLVAIILGMLGVEEQTIVDDYAFSADAMAALLRYFENSPRTGPGPGDAPRTCDPRRRPGGHDGFIRRLRADTVASRATPPPWASPLRCRTFAPRSSTRRNPRSRRSISETEERTTRFTRLADQSPQYVEGREERRTRDRRVAPAARSRGWRS
jgi:hypothetical protein